MNNILLLFCLLFGIWLIFSGIFTPLFIGLGVFSAALSVVIARRMDAVDHAYSRFYMVSRVPFYLVWLTKAIIESSFDTLKRIWQIEPDLSPITAWVPQTQKEDLGRAVYANSITLTPGTASIFVIKDAILVHSLTEVGLAGLLKGEMDRKVALLANPTKMKRQNETPK